MAANKLWKKTEANHTFERKMFHIVIIGVIGITATGEKIINAQLTGGPPLL